MTHITSGVHFNQFAFDIVDMDRIYHPSPPRPVRMLATQAEHDRRAQLAQTRAKEMCRSYGFDPDRTDRFTGEPHYLEFFSDALEQVDAEMIKEDWLEGRIAA